MRTAEWGYYSTVVRYSTELQRKEKQSTAVAAALSKGRQASSFTCHLRRVPMAEGSFTKFAPSR